MLSKDIYDILKAEFADEIIGFEESIPTDSFITVNSAKLFDICHTLRDNELLLFDYLMCLSGTDNGENLGVVYHLYSMKYKHKLVLKVFVPKTEPVVPSVEMLWRTADWHEREAFDLIGVVFEGHHNMIRILCPYDWEGHALRKDYQTPEFYHGMKVDY